MNNLHELISPEKSAFLVLVASILITIIGAGLGFYAAKTRGLIAGLCGPLVFVLWQVHNALTERFGLDSLPLLVAEIVGFVALGMMLGKVWNRVVAFK